MLVPDCRGLDQNFHDVTVVDMGDLPESHVSMPELSELIHKWPPLLPGAMDVSGTDLAEIQSMSRASVANTVPPERE